MDRMADSGSADMGSNPVEVTNFPTLHSVQKLNTKYFTDYFLQTQFAVQITTWAKATVLPGFMGVSVFDATIFLYKELKNGTIVTSANSMSFSFFLSLFPALIVLFTAIAYLPIHKNWNDVIGVYIDDVMPGNAGKILMTAIKDITTKPRGKLLSLGFILAIYFSSNGISAMMQGFEKAYPLTFETRPWWKNKVIAIQLTFLLGALLIASFLLIILGNTILTWVFTLLKANKILIFLLFVLRWLVIAGLFYGGISLIYRYGIPMKKRFSFYTPGAMLASVLSILASVSFSYYVENFGNYNKLYGSIGSLIVLMLWIQLNAFTLLVGFELNAAIAINSDINDQNFENSNPLPVTK